jgi:hypothetical protein
MMGNVNQVQGNRSGRREAKGMGINEEQKIPSKFASLLLLERKERGPRSSGYISPCVGQEAAASSTKTNSQRHPCQRPSLPRPPPPTGCPWPLHTPPTLNSTESRRRPVPRTISFIAFRAAQVDTVANQVTNQKEQSEPCKSLLFPPSSTKQCLPVAPKKGTPPPLPTRLLVVPVYHSSPTPHISDTPPIPGLKSPTPEPPSKAAMPLTQPRQPGGLNEACHIPRPDWAMGDDNAPHSPN